MANRLAMGKAEAILHLKGQGWSNRRIARELGIDRATVQRYVRRGLDPSNAATGAHGSGTDVTGSNAATPTEGAHGSDTDVTGSSAASQTGDVQGAADGLERQFSATPLLAIEHAVPEVLPASTIPEGGEHSPAELRPELAERGGDPDPGHVGSEADGGDVAPMAPEERGAKSDGESDASLSVVGSEERSEGEENGSLAGSGSPALLPGAVTMLSPVRHELQVSSDRQSRSTQESACEPFRAIILAKLEQGLSVQRIHQDLVAEHEFKHRYHSVRRFVDKLQTARPLPFRRMECEPGEEAQVDFGSGAMVVDRSGKRRPHMFRVVLSHSRKGYCEVVWRQRTDDFLRCLENAFWHFGGVPKQLIIDNLKAAVRKADWYDPELHPKIQSFCHHYGTIILPTRPYTPRHKGKVERGVDYVQENALKGRKFASLEEQNRYLEEWECQVADTRIHGTTRRQVQAAFADEKKSLLPLPDDHFPCFQESKRKVHRDGHVSVEQSYYSVPPEYVGHEVWVRWDARMLRVFNSRFDQIAVHARVRPGRFSSHSGHVPPEKCAVIEQGAVQLLTRASLIGPHTARWSEMVIAHRGVEGMRVLVGLLSLAAQHRSDAIEAACETAATYGALRLKTIRQLLQQTQPKQGQFAFMEEHPIIRELGAYGEWVRQSLAKKGGQG